MLELILDAGDMEMNNTEKHPCSYDVYTFGG